MLTVVDGLRVLIIEDQALLAMDLELIVADAGCVVVGSTMDQTGAMALAAATLPEVALVDVNLLDGQTGPEIARALVQTYGSAVVFLTANPEMIPADFSGALGAVSKPFDEKTIREALTFAGRFVREGVLGDAPRRFMPAPWLSAGA